MILVTRGSFGNIFFPQGLVYNRHKSKLSYQDFRIFKFHLLNGFKTFYRGAGESGVSFGVSPLDLNFFFTLLRSNNMNNNNFFTLISRKPSKYLRCPKRPF